MSESPYGDRQAQLRANMVATSFRLRQSASFKQLDDGCTALLVQTLDLGYATNAVFDQSFLSMAEMQHGVEQLEPFRFSSSPPFRRLRTGRIGLRGSWRGSFGRTVDIATAQ